MFKTKKNLASNLKHSMWCHWYNDHDDHMRQIATQGMYKWFALQKNHIAQATKELKVRWLKKQALIELQWTGVVAAFIIDG